MLRKLVVTIVLFAVLAAGVVMALPKLIPYGNIEKIVKDKVHEATGRDLAFSGAKLVFFPDVAVALENASLSNAPWAKDKHMVEVGRLDVALALAPLFERRVEVKRFILKAPVVHLEKNADGHGNWEMGVEKKAEAASAAPASSSPASPAAPGAQGFRFKIGEIKITDGAFSFADRAKNTTEDIGKVDVSATFPDIDSPVHLDGGLDYRGKRVTVTLDVAKPAALFDGKPSDGSLAVKTDDLNAKVSGVLATSGVMLKGAIDADVSSLPKLVAWATGAAPKKMPFEKISFKSGAEATATNLKLTAAALALDDVQAKGDVTLDVKGKPELTARVAVNKLNLDRFTGGAGAAEAAGGGAGAASATAPAPKEGWDTAPIDFSPLKALDADLVLDTQGFSLKGADVGPSKLTAKLKDGVLHASSSDASLFGGKFGSTVSLSAGAVAFKFDMSGVQAQPVLETFAHFKKLSGTADANVDVTSSGSSQKEIIGNLAGKGAVVFRNGSLEGIDLVNVMKMIQSRLASMNVGQGKTDFVEMGGTFTVAKGVADNQDLKMKGPLVQATGAGTIDLPRKYVQYRVIPVLTASSAAENAGGISVPVDIRGPFSDISILPDYKGVLQDALKDPAKLRGQVKDVAKQVHDSLKDLKKDPAAALQGLLGGFGGQQQEAPPAAAAQ